MIDRAQFGVDIPNVSVITIVKDDPKGLELTLESILAVAQSTAELIVIDGGSSVDTLQVITRHEASIAYWETGLDTGITNAFNRGLAQVTHSLVAFLNAGDVWTTQTMDLLCEAIAREPGRDMYCGDVRYLNDRGGSYVVRAEPSLHRQRAYIFHPCTFVTAACIRKVGAYDESYKLAMDANWFHRAMAANVSIGRIDGVVATMALGGVSDRHFLASLREFRRSAVETGQAKPLAASFHFSRVLLGKYLSQLPVLGSAIAWIRRR